ncbi:MAG: ABC transporter substrate-binding protein [Tissierellia bacterium]|nr:ABC transporter substrate-binding protein [Tissierellia bacterium]MDD3227165.1 ABC transporter substrate-binding protein [Tissierellia bacterium]MDD4045770.1 ABC transporter substrate-binding protein [Tissierellia bacterium]MDD4678082.1 ABC transporter substrate-binding protein [Tissierellia bacterium]
MDINIKDTLFNITEKYKEATELLISLGFDNLKDDNLRKIIGSSISLENVLKSKKINADEFVNQLMERIEENKIVQNKYKETIRITGVLPCPVKVPLMETFEKWLSEQNFDFNLNYELKAASMGIDWIKNDLENSEKVPDLFISAGFDLFFDKNLLGKYKSENLFEDITGIQKYNQDFSEYNLEDPSGQYSILGIVPAVFLVNKDELKGRKIPQSWEELMSGEFANNVSLPISDFDLFNALLLNMYKIYGEDGIRRLARVFQKNMHPSEMVKSHMKRERPAITIMPYFFTWMVREGSPMELVWPKDGAIISPIFMLSKKETKNKTKKIVDFFASKEAGEILSHKGKMPSVNPEVDNEIPKENKYIWLGWDFIKENDISSLIKKCENIFNETLKGDDI